MQYFGSIEILKNVQLLKTGIIFNGASIVLFKTWSLILLWDSVFVTPCRAKLETLKKSGWTRYCFTQLATNQLIHLAGFNKTISVLTQRCMSDLYMDVEDTYTYYGTLIPGVTHFALLVHTIDTKCFIKQKMHRDRCNCQTLCVLQAGTQSMSYLHRWWD